MANGNPTARLSTDSIKVSGKPPQREVSTAVSPSMPPRMSTKHSASTATHSTANQDFQNVRKQLSTSSVMSKPQAKKGRHCSSKG